MPRRCHTTPPQTMGRSTSIVERTLSMPDGSAALQGLPFGWVGLSAKFAEDQGIDVRGQLANSGVACPIDDDTPLDASTFLLMCSLVINGLDDEMHGLTRRRMVRGTASTISREMATRDSLFDAASVLARSFRAVNALCDLQLRIDAGMAVLEIRSHGQDVLRASVVEELMAHFIYHQFSFLVGFLLPLSRMTTRSEAHPYLNRQHPYLLCPVTTGPVTQLVFPADQLQTPCHAPVTENPIWDAQRFWLQLHPHMLVDDADRDLRGPVSERVFHLLLERHLSLCDCADILGVTDGELKRQLATERSSFRRVRRSALIRRARPLLQSGFALDDLAECFGYSDARSMRRAIKLAGGGSIEILRTGPSHTSRNIEVLEHLRQQATLMM